MPREYISNIGGGYISPYDLNPLHIPKAAMTDGMNCEINSPYECIARTPGYTTKYTLPTYSGSRNVAVKNWSVDTPSQRELTTLVRASNNMLLYSEDFEFAVWQKTLNGATHTPNESNGPVRRLDEVSGVSTTTTFRQDFTGVLGNTYTFSLYIYTGDVGVVSVRINDNSGYEEVANTLTGQWERITVSRTLQADTNTYVVITLTGDSDIWGAQLEEGESATGYGYTTDLAKPYYIYLRPYYSFGSWIDAWLELTEMRAFKIDSAGNPEVGITSVGNGLGESNDYFNTWLMRNITNGGAMVVGDYTASAENIKYHYRAVVATSHYVVMSRFNAYHVDMAQALDSAYPVLLYESSGTLTISFHTTGGTRYPYVIRYHSFSPFPSATNPLAYDGFRLDWESYGWVSGATQYLYSLRWGSDLEFTTDTGGTLAEGYYQFAVIGILDDSSRIFLYAESTSAIVAPANEINVKIILNAGLYVPRLRSIELYGYFNASGVTHDPLQERLLTTIALTHASWTESGSPTYGFEYTHNIDAPLSTTTPTLFENIQRTETLDNRVSYYLKQFVNGRNYVATGGDTLVFSNIRDITSEVGIYPHDFVEGYGCIFNATGNAESITGLAKTASNDLIIFKDRSTYIYEVQSGRTGAKRLFTAFDGVGCASSRGIAVSRDYGVFWYDKNGIYCLSGSEFKDIAKHKLARYWGRYLSPYVENSFAIFNRKMQEYWIFIQVSGTVGEGTYADYKVFRYSPKDDNWNIAQFPFIPLWVTDDLSGEINVLASDGLYKWGWDTTGSSYGTSMVSSTITIQCPELDTQFNSKTLIQASAQYTTTSDFTLKALVNDETTARSGNARVFRSTKTLDTRLLRHSSNCDHFKLQLDFGAGWFVIRALAVDFIGRRIKYNNVP